MIKIIFLLALVTLFFSCEQKDKYEKLTISDEALTNDNHPWGWQREDCFSCHIKGNFHQYDILNKGVDFMNSARKSSTLYGTDGNLGCVDCHGNNGI